MGCLKVRNIILLNCHPILSRCRGILEQKKNHVQIRGNPLNSSIDKLVLKMEKSIRLFFG